MPQYSPANIAFAFATKSKDFFKIQAWVNVVTEKKHRQELVAGDLASFAISGATRRYASLKNFTLTFNPEYKGAATRLGDDNVHWSEAVNRDSFLLWGTVNTILQHVPQVCTLQVLLTWVSVPLMFSL